jgi:DNA-binding transcriptional ArsR family regulator
VLYPDQVLMAATRLSLVSCPTRLKILLALDDVEEMASGEVAVVTGESKAVASLHLIELERAAAVERRRKGKLRLYRVTSLGAALLEAAEVAVSR